MIRILGFCILVSYWAIGADVLINEKVAYAKVDCENIYQRPGHGTTFYEDNPTYDESGCFERPLLSSTPEEQGMDGRIVDEGIAYLMRHNTVCSLLVFKNRTLVVERYFNQSHAMQSNNVHSVSKSILGILVGIAFEEGFIDDLDQAVADILPEYFSSVVDTRKKRITLRHLLTMSAGLQWFEDYTEYEKIEWQSDWVRAILSQPMIYEPGTEYNYSTGFSHLVSAVLARKTGMNLCEFAHHYLFEPLGIEAEHWGRDPQGNYSGGYNLYLTPRELGFFGLFILNRGRSGRRQIVSEQWIEDSMQPHFSVDMTYSYGYFWWLTELGGMTTYLAWGYGGQYVFIIPDVNLMVVITANTAGQVDPLDGAGFVERYLLPSLPMESP